MYNATDKHQVTQLDLNILLEDSEQFNDNPIDNLNISSNYYSIEEVDITAESKFTIMHLNIQSLPSKFVKLKLLLSRLETIDVSLDCILLCETFLNNRNEDLYEIPGYAFLPNSRKKMTKGGVAIYIKDSHIYKERKDISTFIEGEFESIFIEVINEKYKAVIGEIYRIPNTHESTALKRYQNILQNLTDFRGDIFIGTDQNFDLLKCDNHNNTTELLNMFFTENYIPSITKPTRITDKSATLIDNIYVKCNRYYNMDDIDSGIIMRDISDHFPIYTWFV